MTWRKHGAKLRTYVDVTPEVAATVERVAADRRWSVAQTVREMVTEGADVLTARWHTCEGCGYVGPEVRVVSGSDEWWCRDCR